MTEFSHFPSEILCSVTQTLDGFDIANLWFTGDKRIRTRLEMGGVTEFHLTLRQTRSRGWPKLASRFRRLESLSIRPKCSHTIWLRDVDLASLAPTLKHMKLNFENAEMALLGLPFVISDRYPDPVWSPPTTGEMKLAPLPLAELFPRLETLGIYGEPALASVLIPCLPQTLLTLSLPHRNISLESINALPPNLTCLKLPNVTHFNLAAKFPPGLTTLILRSANPISPKLMSSFPPGLLTLNIASCESPMLELVDFLPPELTSLSVDWNSTFDDEVCARLPRTLRYLTVRYQSKLSKFQNLPPTLQTLITRDTVDVNDEDIALLPPTMTKIHMMKAKVSSACLKYLPAGARSIALKVEFTAPAVPYRFMESLEKLDTSAIDVKALTNAPRLRKIYAGSLIKGDWSALKELKSLTRLRLYSECDMTEEFLTALPETLADLDLTVSNHVEPDVSRFLPRSLKVLRVNANETLSDPFIPHLPPRLTELYLNSINTLSDHALSILPRTLEQLVINYVTQITDEGIRHLPPLLTDCRLERVTLLTNASASLFPRRMTRLYLDRCKNFSDEAVKHFPRTLTSLDLIHNDRLTEECIPDLPPRLDFFRVNNSSLSTKWAHKPSVTEDFIASCAKRSPAEQEEERTLDPPE